MSRIAKAPVDLPQGVTATIAPESVTIKGAKGSLSIPLTRGVTVVQADKHLEMLVRLDHRHTPGERNAQRALSAFDGH